MPLTLKEVMQREEALHREIAERKHLLAAYERIRTDLLTPPDESAPPPPSAELPSLPAHGLTDVPSVDPSAAPIDPRLIQMGIGWGGSRRMVAWAIERLQGNFDLHDIASLLKREGCALKTTDISVVLSRLNGRGEIEQVTAGHGRTGAVYRQPCSATAAEATSAQL